MLVITTVGTSLFERYGEDHPSFALDYDYLRDAPAAAWGNNEQRITRARNNLLAWARMDEKTSAETKSLLKIRREAGGPIAARLIATETVVSRLAAEILCQVMGNEVDASFEPDRDVIKGLQVGDRKMFEKEGLVNLVERIEELNYAGEEVCINITGGYKGVIPYLTIIGQVHGFPLYYIFEDTDELIRIPQAPISINWGLFEKYGHILKDLAGEGEDIYDWPDYKRRKALNDEYDDFQACIWEDGKLAELNAIGKMFWDRYKNSFLVKVLKASDYAGDSRKREVQEALTELYQRLMSVPEHQRENTADLHTYIHGLGDQNDLRHGRNPDEDKYIFKSTKREQIRLMYTPEITSSGLSIRLHHYVRGDFRHDEYIQEFRERARQLKQLPVCDYTDVPLRKP
jgi:putative CRISPR-associated protein (TIGR02619 family)